MSSVESRFGPNFVQDKRYMDTPIDLEKIKAMLKEMDNKDSTGGTGDE